MTEPGTTKERDFLAEFDLASRSTREILVEAGRTVNYLRTLLRDLRPSLPADHPWLLGIDEQIALAPRKAIDPSKTKFNTADVLELDGSVCEVSQSYGGELIYVGDLSLSVHEACDLREWLDKVIPS
jgi:hypothetical protein